MIDKSNIDRLEKIIFNRLQSKEIRFDTFRQLYFTNREVAIDVLIRLRDSLPFIIEKKENLEDELFIISNSALSSFIESHERVLSAVCLFNNSFIHECIQLFQKLALDESLLLDHRVESCMYLIYTEDDRFRSIAIDVLTSIISDVNISDKYRYEKVICKFNSRLGLNTLLNRKVLNVDYDEDLLHTLQRTYFDNTINNVRYRILSGQHLLQMDIVSGNERINIGEEILKIARSYESEEQVSPLDIINIKADAADIVIRLGDSGQKKEAQQIIHNLGFFDNEGKRQSLLTHKGIITYVGDSQNIHNASIRKAIEKFILNIVEENKEYSSENYSIVHSEINTLIFKANISAKDRMKALKSLSRINIDTAVFTEKALTSVNVMIHLWMKLKRIFSQETEEKIKEIKKRFLDELIDMADTCSSGHAGRLANVLAGFDYGVDINISFQEQVIANTSARMQTRMKNIEDNDLKQKVISGMLEDADQEDIDAFLQFISQNTPLLRKELRQEFVEEGWITEDEFNDWFNSAVNGWTQTENRFLH